MATTRWLSRQQKTAQVDTVQITAFDASTVYSLSVGIKDVSVAGDTNVNDTATALAAAWNASTEPEFAEVTATVDTDTITLTADTVGRTFTAVSSVAGGTGTIGAVTSSTANQSPNDFNDAENWDEGSIPGAADDVVVEHGDDTQSIKDGLSQFGTTKTSLTIYGSFEGTIGLPVRNTDGGEYYEYRATYLAIEATNVRIGEGDGNGSPLIRLDLGSVQTTIDVHKTGSSEVDNLEALLLKGTHAANVLNVNAGDVGVAVLSGEVATFATVNVRGGALRLGPGTTLTTVNVYGGTVEINSDVTTLNVFGAATVRVNRAAAIGTLNIERGTVDWRSSGTITQLTLRPQGTFLASDVRGFTITNQVDMHFGSSLLAANGNATLTAGYVTVECRLSDVTIDFGLGKQYTVA